MVAAAIGVMIIVGAKTASAPISGLAWLGELLATLGGVAFAGYLIAIRSISRLYSTEVIVGRTYSWAALTLCLSAVLAHQAPPGPNWVSWAGIIAMALVSQSIGHTGLNASLKWFQPSVVAVSTLLEPLIAAVLASIVFGEETSLQAISGGALLLAAIAVILWLKPIEEPKVAVLSSMEL